MRTVRTAIVLCLLFVGASGCADRDGAVRSTCSVSASDAGVTIQCADGTSSTISGPGSTVLPDGAVVSSGCTVTRSGTTAVIACADGTRITVPVLGATGLDGGVAPMCEVTQRADGAISIKCPDGTQATLPGEQLDFSSLKLIGATTASCGTCHDDTRARGHFAVMTFESESGPVETCGTCHSETGIKPVSAAHARPEFDPPGLRVQLSAPSIDPTTKKPGVRVRLTDTTGALLARDGMSMTFTIAKVESTLPASGGAALVGPYRNYLLRSVTARDAPGYPLVDGGTALTVQQPTGEASTMGVFTLVSPGVYDYRFNAALPADFEASASHVIAVYATRTVAGVRYVGNAEQFFVPNAPAATPAMRNIVRTETCNGCHNPLAAHGGSRQDVQLCLTCHTQGTLDPESGNSTDFNVMIHKIHMGSRLRSGSYKIIGNSQSVHDWSHGNFPRPIENCQTCHTAMDSDRWVTNGSRAACASCHDAIDKSPGQPGAHPFELQPTATCGNANCHAPGGSAPDAIEAHRMASTIETARVFDVSIVGVTVATADAPPVVTIRASTGTRATGAITPVAAASAFSLLDVIINGPNSGFLLDGNTVLRVPKAQLVELAPAAVAGDFTFKLPKTLRQLVGTLGDPDSDSYTLSLRAQYDPTPGALPDNDRVDQRQNPSAAFGAAEQVVARAPIALTEKCNSCHGELSAHAGANHAKNVEQCVMCHTATLDTRARQGANKQAGPTASLRLSTLVHRIHGGAIADAPYKVFGFASMAPFPVLDLSDRAFPGDARDCLSCHAPGKYLLPLPESNPPTRIVSLDADGGVLGQ
jgi:OmcA/MtrC family decaheme c-type cytochrome